MFAYVTMFLLKTRLSWVIWVGPNDITSMLTGQAERLLSEEKETV